MESDGHAFTSGCGICLDYKSKFALYDPSKERERRLVSYHLTIWPFEELCSSQSNLGKWQPGFCAITAVTLLVDGEGGTSECLELQTFTIFSGWDPCMLGDTHFPVPTLRGMVSAQLSCSWLVEKGPSGGALVFNGRIPKHLT